MQLDPNVKGIINLIVAICGVITTIGVSAFPDYIPQGIAKDVVQTAGLIFMVYGGLNSAGNFLSSPKQGALAPTPAPVIVAAQKLADLPASASAGEVVAAKSDVKAAVDSH